MMTIAGMVCALDHLSGVERVTYRRRKMADDPAARAWTDGTYQPRDGSPPRPHPGTEWEPWECWDIVVRTRGSGEVVFAVARGERLGQSFVVRVESVE